MNIFILICISILSRFAEGIPALRHVTDSSRDNNYFGIYWNDTVEAGQDTTMSCVVGLNDPYMVVWVSESDQVLATGANWGDSGSKIFCDPRFRFFHSHTPTGHDEWSLGIPNVRLSDAGNYTCRMTPKYLETEDQQQRQSTVELKVTPSVMTSTGEVPTSSEGESGTESRSTVRVKPGNSHGSLWSEFTRKIMSIFINYTVSL